VCVIEQQNLFELYDSLRKEQVLLCTLYKIITLAVHQLALTYAQVRALPCES